MRPESHLHFTYKPYAGPFAKEGQARDPSKSKEAAERRKLGQDLALKLLKGGLVENEIYITENNKTRMMIALDGSSFRDNLGRARRQWSGYPDHAFAAKTAWGRDICLFADTHGIQDVVQVVVRSPWSVVGLEHLHDWHANESSRLSEMLRYCRKSRAPSLECLLIAVEVGNAGEGGWLLDAHFHLTVVGVTDEELAAVKTFFTKRGWTFWFEAKDDATVGRHPAALVQYSAKGLAHAIQDGPEWSPDALAELRRQTRRLAMVRATGRFRQWKGEVAAAKLTVEENEDGSPELYERPRRRDFARRQPGTDMQARILRFCVHDFGDGVLRRAALVDAPPDTTLSDLEHAYDLSRVISY